MPIQVVYIGGAARSGSTLLARILAQAPGLVTVGEVRHLLQRGYFGLPEGVRCGCGEPLSECPFWTAVRREVIRELPALELETVPALARRVDRIRYLPGMYSPWKTRRFASEYERFSMLLLALYRAILAVSGARAVVDESKDLSLLYLLARRPEVDLRLVHLVRDCRGAAYSWMRRKRRPELVGQEGYMRRYSPTFIAFDWWYRNATLDLVPPRARARVRLRYEDLISHPQAELDRLLDALDLPPTDGLVEDGAVELHDDHLASGNPSRFQHGRIQLRLDNAWTTELSRSRRLWVTALTWPLLGRYGYLTRRR